MSISSSSSNPPRITTEAFLEQTTTPSGNVKGTWDEMIKTIHDDTSVWKPNVLAELGDYARCLSVEISSQSDCFEKIANLVSEVSHHILLSKSISRSELINIPEWGWVKDLAPMEDLLLPKTPMDKEQIRVNLKKCLEYAKANDLSHVTIRIEGRPSQEIPVNFPRMYIENADALMKVLYHSVVSEEHDNTPISWGVCFESETLRDCLIGAEEEEQKAGQLYIDPQRVTKRALDWLNDNIYDPSAINKIKDVNFGIELLQSVDYLNMENFKKPLLTRLVNIAYDNQQLNDLRNSSACHSVASSNPVTAELSDNPDNLETFIKEIVEVRDEARLLDIEIDPNMSIKDIRQEIDNKNLQFFWKGVKGVIAPPDEIRQWLNDNRNNLDAFNHLVIAHCPLTALPKEISLFKNLKYLQIEDTNLAALPSDFNPATLSYFQIRRCPISQFPDNFNPVSLRTLMILSCPITELPNNFNPPNLTDLMISRSNLRELPEGFTGTNLKKIFIEDTPFDRFPANFNPTNLEKYNFNNTIIRDIPPHVNRDNLYPLPPEGATNDTPIYPWRNEW